MTEVIQCLLQSIAPLHLGTDEVYEPLSFVIQPEVQELVGFEPGDFLGRLPATEREQFLRFCREGTVSSLFKIYRFMHKHRQNTQGRRVSVCPGLVEHYQEVLRLTETAFARQLRQFTIYRTAWQSGDQRPYIPGSAVKGALRTAYLNKLQTQQKIKRWKDKCRQLEERLLEGSFATDPFRLVKVSDFRPVGEVKTRVVYAVNQKKEGGSGRGPYQILEVVEPGTWFLGTLTMISLSEAERRLAEINQPLNFEVLWQSARFFYRQEKRREDQELYGLGLPQTALSLPEEVALLRLGRHSGAESVTINGLRQIKIRTAGGRSEIKDHATTLWLASDYHQPEKCHQGNLRPFGWVTLSKLTPNLARRVKEKEEAWQKVGAMLKSKPITKAVEEPKPRLPEPPAEETWPAAQLKWDPGRGEITALWQGRKAFAKGRQLVPEVLHKKLFKDRKTVTARVVVDPGNFQILKIYAE